MLVKTWFKSVTENLTGTHITALKLPQIYRLLEIRTVTRKSSLLGLYVSAGGLDNLTFDQTPLIFISFYISVWRVGALFGGLPHQSTPVATELLEIVAAHSDFTKFPQWLLVSDK